MNDGIDTEYLIELIRQAKCKNNGIKCHINKKAFLEIDGIMINGEHFSFEYLREKVTVEDMLLDTIQKDILLKSGRFRTLDN